MNLYAGIPPRLLAALQLYISSARPVGSFLRACLENDLTRAVIRADPEAMVALPLIVRWMYDVAPGNAWGSPELVARWLRREAA